MKDIQVAVIVGHHSYSVIEFQKLFASMDKVTAYIQHFEEFIGSPDAVRESYDVLLFYTMWQENPTDDGPWYAQKQAKVLQGLGQNGQGLFFMHHSLLAFPDWPPWADMVGVSDETYRDYHLNVDMDYRIVDRDHPITHGLSDFTMTDEAYEMDGVASDKGHVLIETDHPRNIKTVAWTRQHENSRVFCFQAGHDEKAYRHESFARIVRRALFWLAEQPLPED